MGCEAPPGEEERKAFLCTKRKKLIIAINYD